MGRLFVILSYSFGGGATWFFSSYGGIRELRRGIQAASCVGPGKSNLPLEWQRKAGHCSRVTAGPIDLIQACVQKPMFLSRGDRDLGVDRKSTRLNSSHHSISYAVFCLKKKKTSTTGTRPS